VDGGDTLVQTVVGPGLYTPYHQRLTSTNHLQSTMSPDRHRLAVLEPRYVNIRELGRRRHGAVEYQLRASMWCQLFGRLVGEPDARL